MNTPPLVLISEAKKNKSILLLRGYHPMLNMPRIIKTVGNKNEFL